MIKTSIVFFFVVFKILLYFPLMFSLQKYSGEKKTVKWSQNTYIFLWWKFRIALFLKNKLFYCRQLKVAWWWSEWLSNLTLSLTVQKCLIGCNYFSALNWSKFLLHWWMRTDLLDLQKFSQWFGHLSKKKKKTCPLVTSASNEFLSCCWILGMKDNFDKFLKYTSISMWKKIKNFQIS